MKERRFVFSDRFEHWIEVFEGDRDWSLAQSLPRIKYEQWKYNCLIQELKKEKYDNQLINEGV